MDHLAKSEEPAETINVASVLIRLSDELKCLSAKTEQLQVALSKVTAATDVENADALSELQTLDAVTQNLDNLSRVSKAIAADIPEEVRTDASLILGQVSLDALVQRLHCPRPPHTEATERPGELELF